MMSSVIERTIRSTVDLGLGKLAEFNRKRLPALNKPNPYLTGIHKPMTGEETLTTLKVDGEIPPQLDGRYLRIGPNPVGQPEAKSYHWFLGDGMAHGIRLKQGKAEWYHNRWTRSNSVSAALNEPPAPGPRRGSFDTVNTNVIGHAGRTYALVEAGTWPIELNDELDTLAHNPFGGTLQGSYSAHPHLDPATGELHAICYDATIAGKVWHVVVDANGAVIREEPIAVHGAPSIHDCQITDNYVLVFDLPVTISTKMLIAGYPLPFAWNPKYPARVGLCPRTGSTDETVWCDVDPCYVFHPANAFETPDGKVIVDVVAHNKMFARSTLGPDSERSCFERWTIDPVTQKVNRKVLHDHKQEFPRYDERRTCKPYRYVYSVALPAEDHVELKIGSSELFKHDLESGVTETHDFGANRHPGEFAFIPRSDVSAEDDGWLMGLVVDMNDEHSELVILNANNFTGKPQAVVHIPHRIPPGFHGNWVAST
jgi:carotenoid cleavage dioxygenase-like enzyme